MPKDDLDVRALRGMPPWEWPEGAGKTFLHILRDKQASENDRVLAAELAGDFTVINDELADTLLAIVGSSDESERLRGQAAIGLGPALEQMDTHDGEDTDDDDFVITEGMFRKIQASLRRLYTDASIPDGVRRRVLEAAVRAPQDWHAQAVSAAYESDSEAWKLTALFCMRFIRGFDQQILDSLDSTNADIRYEAVNAAGEWEVAAAWPHIVALVKSKRTDKSLLLAAIEAVATIRPGEAAEVLDDLTDSRDEDIAEAAQEAIATAEGVSDEDDEEFDEDAEGEEDEDDADEKHHPRH